MNKTMNKLLRYLKKDLLLIILTILLSFVVSILMIYIPKLFGDAIDLIIEKDNVKFDKLEIILQKSCIIIFSIGIIQWIQLLLNNTIAYRITRRLRLDAFKTIQELPLAYLDSHPTGGTISIIINDVENVADGLILGFTQAFSGITTIIGTIYFMFRLNWIIACIVIVITPLSLFVAKFIASKSYKFFKDQSVIKSEQTAFIDEMVGNLKVVKTYNHEYANLQQFDEINNRLEKCSLKAIFFSSLTNPCTRFVNSVVYAAVALTGALFIVYGVKAPEILSIGGLTCLLTYANQYTKPFNEITSVITELQNAMASASRIFNLIEETKELPPLELENINEQLKGNFNINHVYFSYTKEKALIEDFSIQVKSGQKIAIVGPTGCGKTTMINLLMRFYKVDDGIITIDNIPINNFDKHELRSNYGMVLQDTWIKTGTVIENVKIGNPNATKEEVIGACKKAHCHNFILKLEKGYDTIISEDTSLSVGQRQLLCIARVMLMLPPILILDEATSSIDTRTEHKIQQAFNTLMENKTSFIVAHRLSTIKGADIIIVMKDGNVLETGNHQELLNKRGFYYQLYNSQFSEN